MKCPVNKVLYDGLQLVFCLLQSILALAGDQIGHRFVVQSRDSCDIIPQRCVANIYHPFRARRALFLGRVLFGYYVIGKVAYGILSPRGGSHRFQTRRAFNFATVGTAICAHHTLRAGYAGLHHRTERVGLANAVDAT